MSNLETYEAAADYQLVRAGVTKEVYGDDAIIIKALAQSCSKEVLDAFRKGDQIKFGRLVLDAADKQLNKIIDDRIEQEWT